MRRQSRPTKTSRPSNNELNLVQFLLDHVMTSTGKTVQRPELLVDVVYLMVVAMKGRKSCSCINNRAVTLRSPVSNPVLMLEKP